MGIFTKIKKSFQKKESRTAILNSRLGPASWTPENYQNYVNETYMKNVIAYRCIEYTARSVSSVPWKCYKKVGDKREIDNENPIMQILEKANPEDSFNLIMLKNMIYLMISGNCFFERIAPITGENKGMPKEIYSLRPDKFKINIDNKGRKSGYVFDNTITWEIDPITRECDILQVKLVNPLDDFWGMGSTKPTAREIDSSNEATEWNKKIFENEGRPGMIFAVQGSLTSDQFDHLEKQLNDKYSGSKNAGKTIILESDYKAEIKPYSWSPKEMDFLDSNRELSRRICLGYGVPPMLMGIPGDNTFSNQKEARQAFWEESIIFYLSYFKGELNNWFFKNSNEYFIDYILDEVAALAEKRNLKWTQAQQSDFLTINEKREMVGKDKIPAGDVILIPATMLPLEMAGEGVTQETDVQKLIDEGYTMEQIDEMLGWDKECHFEEGKPYPNEYSCRLKDPGQFTTFRRVNNAAKVNGKRIDFIFGIKNGKSEIQAIRYPKDIWTEDSAKRNCSAKEHILFE